MTAFGSVTAGPLQARLVERRSRLLLERGLGGPVGAIDLPAGRVGPVLVAADGEWTLRYVVAVPRRRKAHLAVSDREQREVATVWLEGKRQRIDLRSESLVFEIRSLHPRVPSAKAL